MSKRITIIGNNGNDSQLSDGGRIKIRLFLNLLEREGKNVNLVELEGWKKNFFKLIISIKKTIKISDKIIIMAGPKGCRVIIPLVLHLNKKHKKEIVFCPLGIGTIDYVIRKLSFENSQAFLNSKNFYGLKDKKMNRWLSRLDKIVLQNETIRNCYEKFYNLKNLFVLENFRDIQLEEKKYLISDKLNLVYLSRIRINKGIFDLMKAVNELNKKFNNSFILTIYGENQLGDSDKKIFDEMLSKNIIYKGITKFESSISEIRNFDLFCFPTKYYGEGTPGALIEALISGTPTLVSNYSQALNVVGSENNSFLFEFNSYNSLVEKLQHIFLNRNLLQIVGLSAQKYSKKYLYDENKENFLKLLG